MLFQEPPRTEYDWHFRLGSIPVRVHPYFWLVGLLMGSNGSPDGKSLLMWLCALFVSILIHEMGHALVIRYFGWSPHIVLYGFGGLAIYDSGFRPLRYGERRVHANSGVSRILISLAGPGAGFLFAALILAVLVGTGFETLWHMFGRVLFVHEGRPLSPSVWMMVQQLLYINTYWGLMNLLPVLPLDGGNVARELLQMNSRDGYRQSLMLSCAVAATVAFLAVSIPFRSHSRPEWYLALLFGYLAYTSYTQLVDPYGGNSWRGGSPWR